MVVEIVVLAYLRDSVPEPLLVILYSQVLIDTESDRVIVLTEPAWKTGIGVALRIVLLMIVKPSGESMSTWLLSVRQYLVELKRDHLLYHLIARHFVHHRIVR